MNLPERRALVDPDDPVLSIAAQCRLLRVSRSTLYYQPEPVDPDDLAMMRRMDELYMASNLQNHADSVIFRRRVYGFSETPASVSWYDGVAKRPDTDQDNKDVGDVAEGDTIHILAPYSRRTSSLARRCDGRSAERASPAIRQRARPGSD